MRMVRYMGRQEALGEMVGQKGIYVMVRIIDKDGDRIIGVPSKDLEMSDELGRFNT